LFVLTLSVAFLATSSAKADITYTIQPYPADQGGHAVSGSITTDGHIGTLTSADIKSWSVTIDTTSFSNTTPNAEIDLAGSNLNATGTTITLSAGTGSTDPGDLATLWLWAVPDGTSATLDRLIYERNSNDPSFYEGITQGNFQWSSANAAMGGTDPWVIASTATAVATAVPEPSTAIVAVFGAVAFLAYGWSRHRREQRRTAAA
jgi:hypothetical protein